MASQLIAQDGSLLPDDILTAIFTLAKNKTQRPRLAFRGHDSTLQEVFRGLAEKFNYPFLKSFVFSDSGPEPYSPVLSESISRLQLSGLVGRENPDYEVLFVSPSAERYFEDVLKTRFSTEEVAQLQEVAEEFVSRVRLR